MSFVAIATCRNIPEPDIDEPLLLAELTRVGIAARMLAWDDDGADWDGAALTVIRSTWNYYLRPGPFLAWALRRGDRLVNPASIVRWNHHKRYLRDLEASGVPVVPTLWVDGDRAPTPAVPIVELVLERGWTDLVAKPAVSAGSHNTHRLRGPPFDAAILTQLAATGDVMVQPYVSSVDTYGERSLVYIDGEITHAIRKSPRFAGGQEVVSEATPIADDERALAHQAIALVRHAPLYARVDVVRDAAGAVMLSELELIEPSLFLRQSSVALRRLVDAIGRRFADAAA